MNNCFDKTSLAKHIPGPERTCLIISSIIASSDHHEANHSFIMRRRKKKHFRLIMFTSQHDHLLQVQDFSQQASLTIEATPCNCFTFEQKLRDHFDAIIFL